MPAAKRSTDRVARAIRRTYRDDRFWRVLLEAVDAGPFDGGCLICARALCSAFGGHLVTLQMHGRPQHYGALIEGATFDFDGPAASGRAWADRFAESEVLDGPLYFVDRYLANPVIPFCQATSDTICGLLLESAGLPAGNQS